MAAVNETPVLRNPVQLNSRETKGILIEGGPRSMIGKIVIVRQAERNFKAFNQPLPNLYFITLADSVSV
jgi:hypothetical protein